MRTHRGSFPALCSALHHVPGITPGFGLLWRLLTFAPSPWQVALQGAMREKKRCLRAIDGSLTPGDSIRMCLDLDFPVVRSGIFRRADLIAREADLPG